MAEENINSEINKLFNESTEIPFVNIKLIEEKQRSEEWVVTNEVISTKCKFRFRKWRPVEPGWYCSLTGNLCLKEDCPKRK